MTIYFDSSSLVKLYVIEPDTPEIKALMAAADLVVTSVVAYAETRAAIARRRRERLLAPAEAALVIRQLDADWSGFLVIPVTDVLARAAGALADRLGLRGFDAVHLAAFEHLLGRADDNDVRFSSADARLTRAAKRL